MLPQFSTRRPPDLCEDDEEEVDGEVDHAESLREEGKAWYEQPGVTHSATLV